MGMLTMVKDLKTGKLRRPKKGERVRPIVNCGPGLTKESEKDQCDINKIMSKYEKTGQLPDMIRSNPMYGDFSQIGDYHQCLEKVRSAEERFMMLSAKVRKNFENDPQQMLDFVNDPNTTHDMLVEKGLAIKKEPETVPEKVPEVKSDGSQ